MGEKNKYEPYEVRSYAAAQSLGLETRNAQDGSESNTIGGYAVKYNTPTLIRDRWGDEYLEEMAEGCFDDSISNCMTRGREIKALWNHDTSKPIGNTLTSTLRFNSDRTGLNYDIDLPDNTWGHDVKEAVKRGDVDGSSFGFLCLEDKWSKITQDGKEMYKRSIIRAELHEVSPCTFPAYDSSEITCRSFDKLKEEAKEELRQREAKEKLKNLEIELELLENE